MLNLIPLYKRINLILKGSGTNYIYYYNILKY
jgi:hypothetical protein